MDKETIFGIQSNRTKVRSNSTEWPSGGEIKSDAFTDSTITPSISSMTFNSPNNTTNMNNNVNNSSTSNANSTNPNNISVAGSVFSNNGASPSGGSLPSSPFIVNNPQPVAQSGVSTGSSKKKDKNKQQTEDEEDSRGKRICCFKFLTKIK